MPAFGWRAFPTQGGAADAGMVCNAGAGYCRRNSWLCSGDALSQSSYLSSAINRVFERLARGEVPSRVVIDFSKG